jgi:hypothetical protein
MIIDTTGGDDPAPFLTGGEVMPLNEIPKYFNPEIRSLVESALEEAWQELGKDSHLEPALVQRRLRRTIVALASVGETDPRKLKWFAIHAWRGAIQAEQAAQRARMSGMAA